jgi:alpha/beta superfamily hydrolase
LERAVLVAPPVDVALCDFSGRCERIGLVVGASDDHFAGAESVKRLAAQWNPAAEIRIIPESNHYLMLETGELTAVVAGYLAVAERSAGAAQ